MPESRRPYRTDLSDAEWALLEPLPEKRDKQGRPPKRPRRLIADATFYLLRSGCALGRLGLPPREHPPWQTLHPQFRRWRLSGTLHAAHDRLRRGARAAEGRTPEPSALDRAAIKPRQPDGHDHRGGRAGPRLRRREAGTGPQAARARRCARPHPAGAPTCGGPARSDRGEDPPRRRQPTSVATSRADPGRCRLGRRIRVPVRGRAIDGAAVDGALRCRATPIAGSGGAGSWRSPRTPFAGCRGVGSWQGPSPGWADQGGSARITSTSRTPARR